MSRTIKVTLNGTGFAGSYTAESYGLVPHKNGVNIELAGICSGHLENAQIFAKDYGITQAFEQHGEMIGSVHPDIDSIACANFAHGPYIVESAEGGVPVIVVEKPPIIWPGYGEGRIANAETRKQESMDYLAKVLDTVRKFGTKLLYAENFVYFDGLKGLIQLLKQARLAGKGKILYQQGTCAHQGSHAPSYDTPELSGGGALFNKACHPLGSVLYLKQIEGILANGVPIRPKKVSAIALQILKHQPEAAGEHFRVMHNVDDFSRISVVFEDQTIAEIVGHDLNISGIRNDLSITTDFAQMDIRINPNSANNLFMPDGSTSGNIIFREKLSTAQGISNPIPNQSHAHGYVNEFNDAIDCVLNPDQHPQSGPLMAWDSMAILMAAYESGEKDATFIDVSEYTQGRRFGPTEIPNPDHLSKVFQEQ